MTIAIPLSEIGSTGVSDILIVDVRIDILEALIANFETSAGQSAYIVDGQNHIISQQIPDSNHQFELPETQGTAPGISGEAAILAFETIEMGEFVLNVVAEKSEAQALTIANSTLQVITFVIVGAILIAIVLSTFAARYIVTPIEQLSQTVKAFQAGNFQRRAHMNRNDEIGDLSNAFDTMSDELQSLIEAERASKTRLEATFGEYKEFAERIAGGDLTAQLEFETHEHEATTEDIYRLGANLNGMVTNLRNMTSQIRDVASAVNYAVNDIQSAASHQHTAITEQNAAITQTMTTVADVRTTVEQTAQVAQQVAESSRQSITVSKQGQQIVLDSISGMEIVKTQVASIAETILVLSERTQQIGEIIEAVNTLADQSKLLALNASIEAARAGDEGKGFAVVAMEVRQLAEESRKATSRVSNILHEIQQATNEAVMVTEEGSKGAEAGMSLAEAAGAAIRDLATALEGAMQAANQIEDRTKIQTKSTEQLTTAMMQIQESSTQAATSAEQTAQKVHNIVEMANQLEKAAARYQL